MCLSVKKRLNYEGLNKPKGEINTSLEDLQKKPAQGGLFVYLNSKQIYARVLRRAANKPAPAIPNKPIVAGSGITVELAVIPLPPSTK